jgi:hypothetical protein
MMISATTLLNIQNYLTESLSSKLAKLEPAAIDAALEYSMSDADLVRDLTVGGVQMAGVYTYAGLFGDGINLRNELNKWAIKGAIFTFLSNPAGNYGHWVCIFEDPQNPNELYVFDSYGDTKPDDWAHLFKKDLMVSLDQSRPLLMQSALESGYKAIEWNNYKLQFLENSINTCGRWCLLRLLLYRLNVEEFKEMVFNIARTLGISTDEVTLITQG